jgi:pimeloyl-ACP methyl ester carboxylesterase
MNTILFHQPEGAIAYDDQGEGPLVLCVPSLGDLRAEYRFLTPALVDAGYRAVTVDLRGLGESSPAWPDYTVAEVGADIVALIRHLEAGPALVVGTSMAAGAAVWAAAEAPDQVRGMVLISPFVRDTMPVWQARLMFTPLFVGPWGPAVWIRYFRTLYPTAPPEDFEPYLDRLRANLKEPGRLAAVRRMMTASKAASEQRLDQVAAPVLVVMGTRDRDFGDPASEAAWVAGHLNGEVHLIEGAGHYPHAEMPETAAEVILPFAQRVHHGAA